ncbi:unnamed protein product [Rangifer tarandus platyrhynchus]|uniref:Uncharacterized protein n=2 Tax=Rangifer tarandus platyrhynchus TaxID=3082113 RepID=A0ABN8XV78_RANTA|nr:unnamed protein product [Rangifer tarandus platyrhynchus]CAI9691736.1 unnamed protein product [Rangifer tarandus platyrhynchus]
MATCRHVPTRVTARSHGNHDLTRSLDLPAWAGFLRRRLLGAPLRGGDSGYRKCASQFQAIAALPKSGGACA